MKYLTVTYAVDESETDDDAVNLIVNESRAWVDVRSIAWFNTCPSSKDVLENARLNLLLREYEAEMDMTKYSLTLPQLIDSHRSLRTNRMISREEMLAENQKIYEHTVKCARESVTEREYIAVEKLKKMTLIELANKISDPYYD